METSNTASVVNQRIFKVVLQLSKLASVRKCPEPIKTLFITSDWEQDVKELALRENEDAKIVNIYRVI